MQIDWPASFGDWLDTLEAKADKGDGHADRMLVLVVAALKTLADLDAAPDLESETLSLKWVRQSDRYPLWRTSHPYEDGIAVRLICWFPPESDTVVVALFATDKVRMGNAFYNTVATRADALIDQYLREMNRWEEER